jgi:hypothetical protein
LKPIGSNGAFDASLADGQAHLIELLGNHLRGVLRVQKSQADDLFFDLVGAHRVGLGTCFLIDQGLGAAFKKGLFELVIALFAVAVLSNAFLDANAKGAFDQHEQLASGLVVVLDVQPGQIQILEGGGVCRYHGG